MSLSPNYKVLSASLIEYAPRRQAQVAQLVEHATEDRSVGSSILSLGAAVVPIELNIPKARVSPLKSVRLAQQIEYGAHHVSTRRDW